MLFNTNQYVFVCVASVVRGDGGEHEDDGLVRGLRATPRTCCWALKLSCAAFWCEVVRKSGDLLTVRMIFVDTFSHQKRCENMNPKHKGHRSSAGLRVLDRITSTNRHLNFNNIKLTHGPLVFTVVNWR